MRPIPKLTSLLAALLFPGAISSLAQSEKDPEPLDVTAPTPGIEAAAEFEVRDGFKMTLLAAEPLVTDPVAICYDEDGRAYVAEMNDYPYTDKAKHLPMQENPTDEAIGKIRLLTDENDDGVFDKVTVFAEGLSWPTGVVPWKGGVFVTAPPDFWYFKDTDGDGVADVRKVIATGFRKYNVQSGANTPIWGLDNRIYIATGRNRGDLRFELADGGSPRLTRERIAICATHTHWAPHLTNLLGNIYGGPLPEEHQERVDAYTEFLQGQLVAVASRALADRKPSHLAWTNSGKVTFAANRRMEDGGQLIREEEKGLMITWNPQAPVDHSLPLMAVRDASTGELRALHFTYACHNVAITGSTAISQFSKAIHGDWVGLTQEELERRHPGIVAVGTIGCGGDQRPDFCGGEDVAMAHAREISEETDRLLARPGEWKAIAAVPIQARLERTELPLSPVPAAADLKSYAKIEEGNASVVARGFVARGLLRRLEKGEPPPSGVPFIAQSWRFPNGGPQFVFLSGEVCIDYQLRIKSEYTENVWPIAYANSTPCYIVSKRMLKKGGYEAGNSMFYYGWLRPLEPGAEDRVMETVAKVIEND